MCAMVKVAFNSLTGDGAEVYIASADHEPIAGSVGGVLIAKAINVSGAKSEEVLSSALLTFIVVHSNVQEFLLLILLLLGRLLRIDLIKWVSNVRPSVHKKFLLFQ